MTMTSPISSPMGRRARRCYLMAPPMTCYLCNPAYHVWPCSACLSSRAPRRIWRQPRKGGIGAGVRSFGTLRTTGGLRIQHMPATARLSQTNSRSCHPERSEGSRANPKGALGITREVLRFARDDARSFIQHLPGVVGPAEPDRVAAPVRALASRARRSSSRPASPAHCRPRPDRASGRPRRRPRPPCRPRRAPCRVARPTARSSPAAAPASAGRGSRMLAMPMKSATKRVAGRS